MKQLFLLFPPQYFNYFGTGLYAGQFSKRWKSLFTRKLYAARNLGLGAPLCLRIYPTRRLDDINLILFLQFRFLSALYNFHLYSLCMQTQTITCLPPTFTGRFTYSLTLVYNYSSIKLIFTFQHVLCSNNQLNSYSKLL